MALNFQSGASLLEDTVVTLYIPGDGDTGVLPGAWGSGVEVEVDKVTEKQTMTTADHSSGQNPYPIHRATKFDAQVDIEFKLFVDSYQKTILAGQQFQMIGVITIDGNLRTATFTGIITDAEAEYSGPSTYKITAKPYAVTGASPLVIS